MIFLSLVIEEKSLFLEEFFDNLEALQYSPDRLILHVTMQSRDKTDFVKKRINSQKYK